MSKYEKTIPSDIKESLGWLLSYIRTNKYLLDVGCSTGYFGNFLKEYKHIKVDGVEISKDALIAKKVLDNVYSFDLEEKWPNVIRKNRYDYILFGDVLEHLKNPQKALIEAKKLVNQGGYVFVSIPNIAHISTRLELLSGSFQYEETGILDNTHLQYFTLNTFSNLAIESGYDIESVDYSYDDFPDIIIKRLLQKCGLSPTDEFWKIANSREARAYQYKFILRPSKASIANGTKLLPSLDKPDQFRDNYIYDLQKQIKNIDQHAKLQAEIIDSKNIEIDTLQKHKMNIHNIKRIIKNTNTGKRVKKILGR